MDERVGDGLEPESLGPLLKRLRTAAALTQEELAEKAQLSERAIRDLEQSRVRAPRLQTIRLIADALNSGPAERTRLISAARPSEQDAALATSQLPRPLTPLIGREDDIAIVELLLADRRLITITGTGGVGKTRFALAVAQTVAPSFDRLVMVELAPLSDPDQVPAAIAAALGLRQEIGVSLMATIAAAELVGRTLLVLDSMEHLLPARELILQLLAQWDELAILVTSREALNVRGERVFTLGPLPLPELASDARHSPAVRLFAERASDAGARFDVDRDRATAVTEICRRLDGLPLAIELAAAWAPLLSPQALLGRLTTLLPQLDHGPVDLPARQRTMRGAIAWSHNLLSLEDRMLFARLSVFSHGWTLAAAEAVSAELGPLETTVLEGLGRLVNKSLVTIQQGDGAGAAEEPRFGMLETVTEYAAQELLATGEAEPAHDAHARFFMSFAELAKPELRGPSREIWLGRLDRERDNLTKALQTASRRQDADLGLRLTAACWPLWLSRSRYGEARRWIDAFRPALSESGVSTDMKARILIASGWLAGLRGNKEAIAIWSEALAMARGCGDELCAADALQVLGDTERSLGNYHLAAAQFEESLGIYRNAGDLAGASASLSGWAGVARYQGNFDQAASLFHEALDLSRSNGDAGRAADTLARYGNMLTEQGRPQESFGPYDEALGLCQSSGNTYGRADVLYRLGETLSQLEEYAGAMRNFDESLRIYRSLGAHYGASYALLQKAEGTIYMGDLDQGEALARESVERFGDIGDRRCVGYGMMFLGDAAHDRGQCDAAFDLYAESLSIHRDLNTRPQIVRCLERMASLAAIQGNVDRAARLEGASIRFREQMGSSMTPAERRRYQAAMRDSAVSEGWTAVRARGASMEPAEAIAFALAGSAGG